ncbi:hypothetical protein BST81_15225 [Leptolyngbya sp. 'hensonii']|uniref:DUF1800 domain-containing protein n=1 Tax=Leptolyngbya sp. 'hensonii' TaxID=1922337 RepID=UPI00094FB558|nr:DUF1800 domain-containing protein [Leptolyngbya sp. 'hensonii']OLP17669.1 hypothetical protein BST81_15225 [Leptolyngbya sp. 'hensonii']
MPPRYWIITLLLICGTSFSAQAASQPADPQVLHVLNRLGYGPRPGDIDRVATIGVKRYIQEQLSPDSIQEPATLTAKLTQLETLKLPPTQLIQSFRLARMQRQQGQSATANLPRQVLEEAMTARLLRAIDSPRQLQEVLTDFWYNHFNVFAGKGLDRVLVGSYEQQAIRPHTLGRFRDLLEATARHPAMLFYLDNWQNTAPNSSGARGRFRGLNENYARELMELHTLGVKGGYTQQDVIALARILTGWGFCRPNQPEAVTNNGFCFEAQRHDFGDKVFLGQTIKGSGIAEVETALDILARHPATARHISYKLAQYFVADRPPQTLVERLTQRFQATDGDLREVLRTLFQSPEFWDTQSYGAKFKTPYQYVVSSLRATGTDLPNFRPILGQLQQMGMPLYGCQTPDGYKNTQDAWLNADAMTRRLNFATVLASGRLPALSAGIKASGKPVPSVDGIRLAQTLGDRFSPNTTTAIAQSPPQLRAALILGSPEFMRR